MKFAKKLQDELYPDWSEEYLDYKKMKKALKQEDAEAMDAFCNLLEAQLHKVHTFMRGQQRAISDDIAPLELQLGDNAESPPIQVLSKPKVLNGHCTQLVEHIGKFRDFAYLNHTAIRKIIKKFDKRFRMPFHEQIGMPGTTAFLVTDHDVGTWLLHPAQHCLRLIRGVAQLQHGSVERPLRQFNFWVAELKAGAQLANLRVSGQQLPNPTALRLRLMASNGLTGEELNPDDVRLCIRNTFIECSVQQDRSHRRAASQPPRTPRVPHIQDKSVLSEDSTSSSCSPPDSPGSRNGQDLSRTPIIALEHFICSSLRIPPPHRMGDTETDEQEAEHNWDGEYTDFSDGSGRSGTQHTSTSPERNGADQAFGRNARVPKNGAGSASEVLPPQRQRLGGGKNAPSSYGAPPGARWWTQLRDICPISGFPVALLPYPPFKLQQQNGTGKNSLRLIDGPYLVLQVLCTWRFEAQGTPLTAGDVAALDAYVRRCKLGPFRLGRALELLSMATADAQTELEALRSRAGRRLEVLRHVQRVRLERTDTEEAKLPSPQQQQQSRRGGRPARQRQ